MTNNDKIMQAVVEAIEELNRQIPKNENLKTSTDTVLFGIDGGLDSLGLVSLVTTIEQKIEEYFGVTVTLLEDIADLENDNPFRTVASLSNYAASILEKKLN